MADSTVTGTDGHPFWVAGSGEWLEAKDLRSGDLLRTAAGTFVQVTATVERTAAQRVHNLSVDELRTYYVLAGDTPVLVHNCNEDQGVYVFIDKWTGKPYVGHAASFSDRLGKHYRNGRRDKDGHVICIHVCGTQQDREQVEAELIEFLGGIENLGNTINSPGKKRGR